MKKIDIEKINLRKKRHSVAIIIAISVATFSFIFASIYTQYRLQDIESKAVRLKEITTPSLEYLAKTKESLDELSSLLGDSNSLRRTSKTVETVLGDIQNSGNKYLELEVLPGEHELWANLKAQLTDVRQGTQGLVDIEKPLSDTKKTRLQIQECQQAISRAKDTVYKAIQHDLNVSRDLAGDLSSIRRDAFIITIVLDFLAVLITIGVFMAVFRTFKNYNNLIEERKRLMEERIDDLDHFAGRVAHDLKNPLATIESALEAARTMPKSGSIDFLEMAERSSNRALKLVNDLLQFARAGANADNKGASFVDDVLKRIEETFMIQSQKLGVNLTIDYDDRCSVPCSEGVLFSILENLVSNALKYIGNPNGGSIRVRSKTNAQFVRISVEDTGPGIPTEAHDAIFEPFKRLDNKGDGFGIGLATVKRLIEACGGSIGLDSQFGKGACFWVEFRLSDSKV